jgi:hypothetical protein
MYSDYSDLEQSLMKQSLVTSRKNDRLHRLSLVHPQSLNKPKTYPAAFRLWEKPHRLPPASTILTTVLTGGPAAVTGSTPVAKVAQISRKVPSKRRQPA